MNTGDKVRHNTFGDGIIINAEPASGNLCLEDCSDEDYGDKPSRDALDKISGAKFAYDVNGYDLVVAQLLVWMDTKTQPKKAEDFEQQLHED